MEEGDKGGFAVGAQFREDGGLASGGNSESGDKWLDPIHQDRTDGIAYQLEKGFQGKKGIEEDP